MINFLKISNIRVGDYLHTNGAINNIASSDIIGVCVIPSNFLPDNRARFISMVAMDPDNKEKGNCTTEPWMEWYYNGLNSIHDFLVKRKRVPLDNTSEGTIDEYGSFGRMPLLDSTNPKLTITNPQDPKTRYFCCTTHKIPSPYAPDGSFNPNFHYRESEHDDNWALTDYRGDLNTREVVCSEKSREEYCPAFYCCYRFSPGYRDHEWYLPAVGELAFIPPRLEIIRDKMQEAINAGSPGIVLSSYYYWSSTEYDSSLAWYVGLNRGYIGGTGKYCNDPVRAFLAI